MLALAGGQCHDIGDLQSLIEYDAMLCSDVICPRSFFRAVIYRTLPRRRVGLPLPSPGRAGDIVVGAFKFTCHKILLVEYACSNVIILVLTS
jgi:hypothetical protein